MSDARLPGITITRATQAEVDEIAPLFDAYRRFYEQPSDITGAHNFLSERIRLNESTVLLARRAKKAVGFVQLYPSYSSVSMRRIWILNDLYVSPDACHGGVATALLEEARKYGIETNAVRLELSTAKDNEPAKRLYTRSHWQEDEVFVHYLRVL